MRNQLPRSSVGPAYHEWGTNFNPTMRTTLIGDVVKVPRHEHDEKSQTPRGDPRSVDGRYSRPRPLREFQAIGPGEFPARPSTARHQQVLNCCKAAITSTPNQLGHSDVSVTARHYAKWIRGSSGRHRIDPADGEVAPDLLARLDPTFGLKRRAG